MVLILLALSVVVSSWTWEFGRKGRCPHEDRLEIVDLDFFNNDFYEIVRTKQPPFAVGDCYRPHMRRVPDTLDYNIDVSVKIGTQYYHTYLYFNFLPQPGKSGEFDIKIGADVNHGNIIASDFQNYFVVLGCNDDKENRRDYFEIFARSPDFDVSSLLHLAYDRDFVDEDFYRPIQDPSYCS